MKPRYFVGRYDGFGQTFRIYGTRNFRFPPDRCEVKWSGDSLDEARKQQRLANIRPNITSNRPPELAGLWDLAEDEPVTVNLAAADVNR